jgi:hypothetical protein
MVRLSSKEKATTYIFLYVETMVQNNFHIPYNIAQILSLTQLSQLTCNSVFKNIVWALHKVGLLSLQTLSLKLIIIKRVINFIIRQQIISDVNESMNNKNYPNT